MKNKKKLINQIIYRSLHRGTKEMDILLGSFVKKHVNNFEEEDLEKINELLNIDDEVLYKFYFHKKNHRSIENNKVTKLFKKFKL